MAEYLSEIHLFEISLVGLLTSVATVVDMYVAILGDGKYEIIKHLFFQMFYLIFLVLCSRV